MGSGLGGVIEVTSRGEGDGRVVGGGAGRGREWKVGWGEGDGQ